MARRSWKKSLVSCQDHASGKHRKATWLQTCALEAFWEHLEVVVVEARLNEMVYLYELQQGRLSLDGWTPQGLQAVQTGRGAGPWPGQLPGIV